MNNRSMFVPTRMEIFAMIATNSNFVEKSLLDMYNRHQANIGLLNGKGFSRLTKKDGVRLGRWLAGKGKGQFTSGHTADGDLTRAKKTREAHLEAARGVLNQHVDQIIEIMEEKIEAASLAAAREAARRAEVRRQVDVAQVQLSAKRSAEVLAMLDGFVPGSASLPDEAPTERQLGNPAPWRGTGYRRTG